MIDFGHVDAVDAEAIGPPGQRTFRLRARVGDSSAAVWVELAAVGRSFSQILAERSSQRGEPGQPVEEFGSFPQQGGQVDFRIARMGLDFDDDEQLIVLLVDDEGAAERGDSPAFRMALDRNQALNVMAIIEEAVAAGRPLCPLCQQALEHEGQDHFCPRTNGHTQELEIPEEEQEDLR
jgi:uncharacterized repeat protein (TIGR03847 family)